MKRLLVILLVGLLVIVGATAGLYFRFACPVGSGPAGPEVGRQGFAQAWTSRPVLLVGLGDSVTAGFGARRGASYFDRLARNSADEFPEMKGLDLADVCPKLQVTNLSVSGSTSSEVLQRQLHLLPTNPPEMFGLVVMTTGGNDLIHNYGRTPPREEAMYGATVDEAKPWVDNFARRLEATLGQIESRFPGGCEIYLANIFEAKGSDPTFDTNKTQIPKHDQEIFTN